MITFWMVHESISGSVFVPEQDSIFVLTTYGEQQTFFQWRYDNRYVIKEVDNYYVQTIFGM